MTGVYEFMSLFLGNQWAYGGDQGKAIRTDPKGWTGAVVHHWDGSGPAIGVYPLVHNLAAQAPSPWVVRWGCVDFDIKSEGHEKYDYETEAEAHAAACNLLKVLGAFGLAAWVERTRSHGRHVWVFSAEWVTAKDVRECLLVCTDIAGVSQREVNPKSDGSNLTEEQLGNYVRLPYPAAGPGPDEYERAIFSDPLVDSLAFLERKDFIERALKARSAPADFAKVAGLYRPPVPVIEWAKPDLDEYNGDIPKVVKHVIVNGPLDGDRSKGLLYIAHECKKAGLSPKAALDLVSIADDAWGKYTGRRDREQRLIEIVERAWQ